MTTTSKSPLDYLYIRAWGQMMGSHQWYISEQVTKAKAAGAPQTAIYQERNGPTGVWATVDQIVYQTTRDKLEAMVAAQTGDSQ